VTTKYETLVPCRSQNNALNTSNLILNKLYYKPSYSNEVVSTIDQLTTFRKQIFEKLIQQYYYKSETRKLNIWAVMLIFTFDSKMPDREIKYIRASLINSWWFLRLVWLRMSNAVATFCLKAGREWWDSMITWYDFSNRLLCS